MAPSVVVPQGMENTHLQHWVCTRTIPLSSMKSVSPLLSQKEKDIRKIQENNRDWNFADFLGKLNIIPDSDWYIIYHSTDLKLMDSQVPSSSKDVAQFPRADRKWTEREACWKATQKRMCTSPREHEVPHPRCFRGKKLSSCLIMSHSGLAGGFLESKKAPFLVLFVHKSSHYATFWQ